MAETDSRRPTEEPTQQRGVLPTGTRLRIYEVISVLGQGAFGITYRARDTQLQRDVAIKEYLPISLALREGRDTVVPRSTATAADFRHGRERFLDEARTLARLDHMSSIVRVIDFLEANGTAYMVMALARGETLAARLEREGTLGPKVIERLLPPLLEGLEEVHDAGFLHRDIKPSNLLIDQRGVPTLIDFGASRAAMAGRSTTLTAIFTPGYAAAEQFTSAKQGPWTDIYGLSATLYHAITGAPPPSAFDRMLEDSYVPLTRGAPLGLRPSLLSAIDSGLAVRSSARPQSIAAWRTLIEQNEDRSDKPVAATPKAPSDETVVLRRSEATAPLPSAHRSSSTRWRWLTGSGIAATIVLLIAGWYSVRYSPLSSVPTVTAAVAPTSSEARTAPTSTPTSSTSVAPTSNDPQTPPALGRLSNSEICGTALASMLFRIPGSVPKWEEAPIFAPYVEEARRRQLTPVACSRLIVAPTSSGTQTSPTPPTSSSALAPTSRDTQTPPALDRLSNAEICGTALASRLFSPNGIAKWEEQRAFAPYVEEAKRRQLTPEACNRFVR